MRRLFRKRGFYKRYFQQEALTETAEELHNPARGWYRMFLFQVEQEPELEKLSCCLRPEDTLVLLFFDIGSYRDRDLDGKALERISRVLDYFTGQGYECIVRAAYDHEGRAPEREPAFFTQVLKHLKQLGAVMSSYASSVFVYQGMLAGNWGEMHTSRFLSEERMLQMTEVLRTCLREQTYLAVRRPLYWRRLHEQPCGGRLSCTDGMGLFDDGMFASESHLGTFGTGSREYTPWDHAWNRRDELYFERAVGDLAPVGGEAVYGDEYTKKRSAGQVLHDLYQMQVTYLNRDYDGRVLDLWRQMGCGQQGIWAERSVYDYVSAHLGYRFLVRNVRVKKRGTGCRYLVEIELENIGFGGFYQEAEICLEYADSEGVCRRTGPIYQMKGFRSDESRTISCTMEAGEGDLMLYAERLPDHRRIFFANRSDTQGRVRLGSILSETA